MTITVQRVNLFVPDSLVREIEARGNRSESFRESLSRYFYVLARAREEIRERFSVAELSLLCDVCNSTLFESYTLGLLSAEAEDCEQEYYSKWAVDRSLLLAKLNELSLAQAAALVDAIERYWRACGTGMQVQIEHLLD